MTNIAIAFVIGVFVALTALVLRRRSAVDAPTQKVFTAPTQIDRSDFPTAEHQWMVAVFTAQTCHVCADMLAKAQVVASTSVSVVELEYSAFKDLHGKYNIEAVPTIIVTVVFSIIESEWPTVRRHLQFKLGR